MTESGTPRREAGDRAGPWVSRPYVAWSKAPCAAPPGTSQKLLAGGNALNSREQL